MGRAVRTESIVLGLCVVLVAIAGLAPIAVMAVESFWHNGHFSLNHYRELISAARFWPLLGNSIRLALATTAVCGLIGVPAGIRLRSPTCQCVPDSSGCSQCHSCCRRISSRSAGLASSHASDKAHPTGCLDSAAASLCYRRFSFLSPCS